MRCGLALDLPSASEEALHHITRVEVLGRNVVERTALAGGLRTAERGEIRRPCASTLLSDRHAAQVLCQPAVVQVFRATARVIISSIADLRAGRFCWPELTPDFRAF